MKLTKNIDWSILHKLLIFLVLNSVDILSVLN